MTSYLTLNKDNGKGNDLKAKMLFLLSYSLGIKIEHLILFLIATKYTLNILMD